MKLKNIAEAVLQEYPSLAGGSITGPGRLLGNVVTAVAILGAIVVGIVVLGLVYTRYSEM